MASVITDVQPRRFRAGDEITITGSGFSAAFGINRVAVNLSNSPLIVSESDTVIVAEVPAGIPTNQQIEVIVSRNDTQEASLPFNAWSLATTADMRDIAIAGQVPGVREAAHLDVDVKDVGQARDYERTATHALRIANEILTAAGDIFAGDGSLPERFPIGGGGMELHTRTAEALDLHWGPSSRWINLRFGIDHDQSAAERDLVANGGPGTAFTLFGTEHGVPFDGELTRVGVLGNDVLVGDTIDQVRVFVNGAQVYTSGAGLGLTDGQSHIASLSVAVQQGDIVRLLVQVLGGTGNARLSGAIRLQETTNIAQADLLAVTDSVSVQKVGSHERAAADSVAVADTVAAELL